MDEDILAHLIVASLKPQVGPVKVTLLGAFFAPAKWLSSKLHGGAYIPGDLRLTSSRVYFEPDRMRARLHREALSWSIDLTEITEVLYAAGIMMGTIEIRHSSGVQTMKCVKGVDEFLAALEAARKAAA